MARLDVRARALRFLEDRGAATIAHPGGTLLAHLVRTEERLARWGTDPDVCSAGLCHAAYGTDGFPTALIGHADRATLVEIVGARAESIVYLYGSCDRSVLHGQVGVSDRPELRDRFTGETRTLCAAEVDAFVTLTVANELDIVAASPAWATEHGPELATMFRRWEALMAPPAVDDCRSILGRWRSG